MTVFDQVREGFSVEVTAEERRQRDVMERASCVSLREKSIPGREIKCKVPEVGVSWARLGKR